MRPNLTPAEVNHLRRLLGWVRCEVGQSPDEMIKTVREIAGSIQDVGDEGKARLVEAHQKSESVPKYVRSAVKALEKLLVKQDGVIIDVDSTAPNALPDNLPAALLDGESDL